MTLLVDLFVACMQLASFLFILLGALLVRSAPRGPRANLTKHRFAAGLLAAAIVPLAGHANAQSVRSERNISAALAQEVAAEALAACTRNGHNTGVAVVDRAGHMLVALRADMAGPHTTETARRKAYTSAASRRSTTDLLALTQKVPASAGLAHIADFILLGGGLTIVAGNDVIGAIGVSGAPGGHLDDQCAEAGIARIKDRLN